MSATALPCAWAPADDPLYRNYHDTEWGVPEYDPRALWEKLQLDGMQAGLAWITILRKRETIREEFEGFDPERIARWDEARIEKALTNPGIIRSRKKVEACVSNARLFLDDADGGSAFPDWLWAYAGHKPIIGEWADYRDAPAKTAVSEGIAKALKKKGYKFCGPVIVYAYLQAVGIVNDHELACPRRKQVQDLVR